MDRRQRRTRRAIYTAFEELMTEEHYGSVTVAQIIERADIGRSTFYAHFETKDELLDEICTEMFDHIFEGVNTHCMTHADLEDNDLPGRLAHLLYHLRDTHGGICAKLLMEGEPHFTADFCVRLRELIEANTPQLDSQAPTELLYGMLVSALCQAVTWWFGHGCTADPEVLAGWYADLVPRAGTSAARRLAASEL